MVQFSSVDVLGNNQVKVLLISALLHNKFNIWFSFWEKLDWSVKYFLINNLLLTKCLYLGRNRTCQSLDSVQQFPFQVEFYIAQQETRTEGNWIGFHFYSKLYLNLKSYFKNKKNIFWWVVPCVKYITGRF